MGNQTPPQSSQRPRQVATAALTCLLLTGCSGQKPSFPSFSWTGFSRPPVTQAAPEFQPPENSTSPAGLAHVALNESQGLGEAEEFGSPFIQPASAAEHRAQSGRSNGHSSPAGDEMDAAFAPRTAATPHPMLNELEQFEQVVNTVEQGESHLGALKASLNQLQNTAQPTAPTLSLDNLAQQQTQEQSVNPNEHAASVRILEAAEETPHLDSSAEAVAAANSPDFPWANSTSPPSTAAGANTSDRVRQLLNSSMELIQQNNLIAARTVAESAQTLLQRTQAALSPGEVTPQQVLADIKARQQQHEQLAANRKLMTETQTPGQAPAVKIDLSREWLNAHNVLPGAQEIDEVQRFAAATVKANAAAALPVITPGNQTGQKTLEILEQQAPHAVAAVAPQLQELSNRALHLPQETQVVRLGTLSTEQEADTQWVSGEQTAVGSDSEIPSLPPLNLGETAGTARSAASSSAPLLLGPGSQTTALSAGADDFDEFAADFGDLTQTDATALETAPLLIDEAQLQGPIAPHSSFSPVWLTLLIGGIGLALMLLFRWRR